MPNGHVGDDWFTDIVAHGLPTFSAEADALVSEIAKSSADPRPDDLISVVDAVLESVGYDELAARQTTVGMEYRNLTRDEQSRLEEDLRSLRNRKAGNP